ncbi:MAG TPA: helix-turn-helix domain-containing protein [Polyangiaceae bacterium]|nr:helix-turn-helix domain-containing protein [Polyangiaceae bacterium]
MHPNKFEKWTVANAGALLQPGLMPTYGQFCPVAQALELVGERWTLLVVRELLCGNYRFNEILHGVPLMSRSLLSQRLKTLEEAGLVERHERAAGSGFEYRLTPAGRELEPVVSGLGIWGKRWVRHKLTAEELDPVLFMWDLRRRLDTERLPREPTVVMFWFRDMQAKRSRFWLRVERPEVELCLTNPGLEVMLTVETTLRAMVDVWLGDRKVDEALHSGAIELKGPPRLTRTFPNWLLFSDFAPVERTTLRHTATTSSR